jgi:hypothetical protein
MCYIQEISNKMGSALQSATAMQMIHAVGVGEVGYEGNRCRRLNGYPLSTRRMVIADLPLLNFLAFNSCFLRTRICVT